MPVFYWLCCPSTWCPAAQAQQYSVTYWVRCWMPSMDTQPALSIKVVIYSPVVYVVFLFSHTFYIFHLGTKFGAMLDMLTDRCATMCLLVNLALLYPSYTFLFQLSMCLDVASHWLHLHRFVNPWLEWLLCLGDQMFFSCYLHHWYFRLCDFRDICAYNLFRSSRFC